MAKEKTTTKRGQGEGSIHKRKDGRWVAVLNLGYQNGKLKRKYYYGKTRKEVVDKLTAALADQQKGIPVITERQTVGQFFDHWLKECAKNSVRSRTYSGYETILKKHVKPRIGNIQLAKLTPQHVQAMLNECLESGLSGRTVHHIRTVLRTALNRAVKWGLVVRNVAALTDPPRVEKYKVQPITSKDAQNFLKAIEGDRFEALFTVALALGLRRGEALALRWQDIDFDRRILRVKHSLQRFNGKLHLAELKTESSQRALHLPEILIRKLRDHRTRQLEERMAAGEHWKEHDRVFASSIGTPMEPRNLNRHFNQLLEDAKLPHVRLHDLRHFCASLLLAQGVPLKTISEILGHSQISTTADIYAHLLEETKREAISLMDSILTAK